MTTTRRAPRPKSVLIGSVRCPIEFVDSTELVALPDKQFGDFECTTGLIRIARDYGEPFQRVALWHEILHGICAVYGPERGEWLNYYVKRGQRESMVIEEFYVAFMETGTLQVIRDNPKVWDWIQGV